MNMCLQGFVWTYVFIPLGYILRSGIAWLTFWVTGKLFSKAATPLFILTSNAWGSNFSLSLLTLITVFWIIVILLGVKWFLTVALIYISLMTYDVEHLSMCVLDICYLFWRDVYSYLLFFVFLLLSCKLRVLYIFWILAPYQI